MKIKSILLIILFSLILFSMQLCSIFMGNKPTITITYPENNQEITETTINLKGTISDSDGDANKVEAWIEDSTVRGLDNDVSSGNFEIPLDLSLLQKNKIWNIVVKGYDANENESETVSVSIYLMGQSLLYNWNFSSPDFNDNDIVYDDVSKLDYLNNASGDRLYAWQFYIDKDYNYQAAGIKIDIAEGLLRIYTTKTSSTVSSFMFFYNYYIQNFYPGDGKKIRIKFKINNFSGNAFDTNTYHTPILIYLWDSKYNKVIYPIAVFTTKEGSAAGGYLKKNLSTNTIYTFEFSVPTLTLGGNAIPTTIPIDGIVIESFGYSYDVEFYYIALLN